MEKYFDSEAKLHYLFCNDNLTSNFVGFCKGDYFVEYYPNGSLGKFIKGLTRNIVDTKQRLAILLKLSLNYVKAINYMHNNPLGVWMNCDTKNF